MGCCSLSTVLNGYNMPDKPNVNLDIKTQFFYPDNSRQRAFRLKNNLYIEQEKIGSGSFSDVYLYKRECDNSLHALKILKDNTTTEALLKECSIMKEVKSQYVIEIEEILQIDEFLCILMEYADQGTLESFIKNISNQTKVIHRDLKMQNLLVSNYQIKIADLGEATFLISKSYAETKVGNILYAAPEKMNEKYNSSIDIFSAGLIILQLMIGLSNSEIFKLKVNNNYSSQIEDSPENLKRFLVQLLDKNPESRPDASSAYNLCRALKYNQEVLNYINNRINSTTLNFCEAKIYQNSRYSSYQQKLVSTAAQDSNLDQMKEDELFKKGMELFWNLDLITAEKCFSLIMHKNPLSFKAICGRLLCGYYFFDWINMKQYSKQWEQEQLQLIEQLNTNNYMYYLCQGILNNNLYLINKCIDLNPQFVEAIAWKGTFLINKNKIQEGIKYGQQALEMSGNNPFVLRMLGNIYLNINKDISEKFYLRSLQSNPNQYLVLYELGKIHLSKNQQDKALYYFNESLQLCPYYKNSINEMLSIMSTKEQYKDIISYIEKLFQQFGELDFLFFHLAYSFQQVGDTTKSLFYYTKSLIYSEDGIVLNNIGVIFKNLNEYEKAKEYFQRSIEKEYKLSFLNMFYLLNNDLDQSSEAQEYLIQLQELDFDENNEEDCKFKIESYRLLMQYDEGLNYSEQILKQHPSSKAINSEILKLISQRDFTDDLQQQFKISELIQKREGISYESTICQLKYFTENQMHDIVVTQILNYFEDAIHKEQTLKQNYRFSFEEYVNQNQIEKIFLSMKKMCLKYPQNIHCQLYFLNLIFLMDFEFSESMINDFNQVYYDCYQLFNTHPDKSLIQLLKIEYESQMQYYLFKHDDRLDLFQYEELQDLLEDMEQVDTQFKEKFSVFHIRYNQMLGIAKEAAEELSKSYEEIDDLYQLRIEKRNEAIQIFPYLKDHLD
ncbi:hypothetical protein ABPG72_017523 [Tetrahymena utriculariae]